MNLRAGKIFSALNFKFELTLLKDKAAVWCSKRASTTVYVLYMYITEYVKLRCEIDYSAIFPHQTVTQLLVSRLSQGCRHKF